MEVLKVDCDRLMKNKMTMMKLACQDIKPDSECHFETTGETAREAAEKMMTHAKEVHQDDLAKMNMSDEDMMAMMESKAHE